jgi:hypothetical protein
MQSGDSPSSPESDVGGPSPALDATADRVSVLVSFVIVRGGSVTPVDGRVEHVADADDRA